MLQMSTNEERYVWPPFGDKRCEMGRRQLNRSGVSLGYGMHHNFETIGCIAEGACYDRATTHFKRVGEEREQLWGDGKMLANFFRASPTGPRLFSSTVWHSASTSAGTKKVSQTAMPWGKVFSPNHS